MIKQVKIGMSHGGWHCWGPLFPSSHYFPSHLTSQYSSVLPMDLGVNNCLLSGWFLSVLSDPPPHPNFLLCFIFHLSVFSTPCSGSHCLCTCTEVWVTMSAWMLVCSLTRLEVHQSLFWGEMWSQCQAIQEGSALHGEARKSDVDPVTAWAEGYGGISASAKVILFIFSIFDALKSYQCKKV